MAAPRRFYHRTTHSASQTLLSSGFHDAAGDDASRSSLRGVWIATWEPSVRADQRSGNTLVAIDIDPDLIQAYEWRVGGESGQFLVPAEILNRHGRITLLGADEDARWERGAARRED